MKIVAIEANIAAGKTTLLDPLAQALSEKTGASWKVIREPVDEDPVFLELLQVFVENPAMRMRGWHSSFILPAVDRRFYRIFLTVTT